MNKNVIFFLLLILFVGLSGCVETTQNNNQNDSILPDESDDTMNWTQATVKTIQQVLDTAQEGDGIILSSGLLNKTIYVNTSVTLTGTGRFSTILTTNISQSTPVFLIDADECRVSNMTLINMKKAKKNETVYTTAIEMRCSQSLFEQMTLSDYHRGINLRYQEDNIIRNISIANATTAVEIYTSSYNQVDSCQISNCTIFGVFIGFDASDNKISDCLIQNCDNGVRIKSASDNMIVKNTFVACRTSYHECCGAQNNLFSQNTEIDNN
jgi:parallel beta-helix repeat protein